MSPGSAHWQLLAYADAEIRHDPAGPLYGRLAEGMALGAVTAVVTGAPWNSLHDDSISTYQLRIDMGRIWAIHDAQKWFDNVTALIGGRAFSELEAILAARIDAGLTGHASVADTDEAWRDWLIRHDYDAEAYEQTRTLIEPIHAAEARLRPDFLADDEIVSSAAGFSLGWAVRVAGWGVQSGYGNRPEALSMIHAARTRAAEVFDSWCEFAASAALGTLVCQNTDWPALRRATASLLTAAHSPWVALDFGEEK